MLLFSSRSGTLLNVSPKSMGVEILGTSMGCVSLYIFTFRVRMRLR